MWREMRVCVEGDESVCSERWRQSVRVKSQRRGKGQVALVVRGQTRQEWITYT